MAKISASGLTFCYDGSYDDIFYEASFIMDTNWKLGLIGRNGAGKTTLLSVLTGHTRNCHIERTAGLGK